MRKLLRSVARHNMLRAGIKRFNKRPKGNAESRPRSFFAKHWREYV